MPTIIARCYRPHGDGDTTTVDVYRERELKFDVPPGYELPDVADVLPGTETDQHTVMLSSTYYDTVGLDLLGHRLTLRRRTGDTDTGWQLKIPAGTNGRSRDEISTPLDRGVVTGAARVDGAAGAAGVDGVDVEHPVPDVLTELLTGIVRPAELAPVARLDTERRVSRMTLDGELVVEVADDRVTATVGGRTDAWREVEVELGPAGDEQALADFARRLRRAGARPSASGSKLARALSTRDTREVRRSPAGELVASYLSAAHRSLIVADIGLRRGDPDAVHDTRVAVRRVRSVLRVFCDVLGATTARALDAELSWLQDLLGAVRDRQVQRARLAAALVDLPPELVLGPVTTRVEQTLLAEQSEALAAVTAALATNRYRRLLTSIGTLAAGDPVVAGTTRTALRAVAESASRTAARRLRTAARSDDPIQWHRARKAVKRARYAAELVGRSTKTIHRFETLQDVLGAHQDAVVAAAIARRLGAAAGTTVGENGFTYGLLHQRELDHARTLRADAHELRVPR